MLAWRLWGTLGPRRAPAIAGSLRLILTTGPVVASWERAATGDLEDRTGMDTRATGASAVERELARATGPAEWASCLRTAPWE